MADPMISRDIEEDERGYSSTGYSSESGEASDDDSSEDGDSLVRGNDVEDDDIDIVGDSVNNISETLAEEYVSELFAGCPNANDYYGDSDMEAGYEDIVDTDDSGESSSVNKSEVTEVGLNGYVNFRGHAEDKLEALWKIKEMMFAAEPAAYVFYNSYAKDNGFSIRKDIVRRSKGPLKELRLRRYVCSREGKRDSKLCTGEGRTRRLRAESRCECNAHLTVKFDRKRKLWYVSSFDDNHNHILARPDEVPFLWSHRKINECQKAEILSMVAQGVRKSAIMDSFIGKNVWFGGVGFVRRDLYNCCAKEKRKLLSQGDGSTVIGLMETRKKNDPSFFFEYELDDKGRLNRMFWCDAQSRQDYNDFGDVLVFDSTYKMNRYDMPFIPFVGLNNHRKTTVFGCGIVSDETEETYVWLLRTFLRAMCQRQPKSVITDADNAMIRAILEVLPDVWHRICSWHVEKNMKIHLCYKSLNEFRTLLYYTTSPATWEQRWHAFVSKWQKKSTKTWLRRMYRKRRLWAASYLAEGYWLGMKSNQRSESLNSCLHLHLDGEMTLVDMVVHYEVAIVRIRENEARDDCTASQTCPVPITGSKDLEVAVAQAFTAANFYMLQDELKKISGIDILERSIGSDSETFMLAWRNNHKSKFYVEYRPKNLDDMISCSCKRMVRRGLPCKHILHVLKILNFTEIPTCCVLRRFSKDARHGLPAKRQSDLFAFGWFGAAERMRYSQVSVLVSQALHASCRHPALFKQLQDSLKDVISKSYEYDAASAGPSCFARKEAEFGEASLPVVGDPIKVSAKGAPKKSSKKVEENRPVTKNGRPLSFDEHRTRCGACKEPGHNRRNKKCKLNAKNAEEVQD